MADDRDERLLNLARSVVKGALDRGAGVAEATRNMFKLWRGQHPMPKMHDFFVERVRMDFDRDVPFQMGGDIMGLRRSLEFDLAEESVQLVDWRQLQRLVA